MTTDHWHRRTPVHLASRTARDLLPANHHTNTATSPIPSARAETAARQPEVTHP
jgi:hypothetical protein